MRKLILTMMFAIGMVALSYGQYAVTKYTKSGNLFESPKENSKVFYSFKNGHTAYVKEYAGNDWWLIDYPSKNAYTHSTFMEVTKEMEGLIPIWNEKNRLQSIKDSIYNVEQRKRENIYQIQKRKSDSILLVQKRKRDSIIRLAGLKKGYDTYDSISVLENIDKYASDSLLSVKMKAGAKGKTAPIGNLSNTHSFGGRYVKILDYNSIKDYFTVYDNGRNYYVKPFFFESNYVIENEYVKALSDFRNDEYVRNVQLTEKKEAEKKARAIAAWKEKKAKDEQRYIRLYGQSTYNRIKRGDYWIGMTEGMAIAGGWYPGSDDVNRTVNRYGTSEQWVCKNGVYLYFDDGILTAYQD